MTRFESNFDIMANPNDVFSSDVFLKEDGNDQESKDIIIQHMDIREPLSKLKVLLERKLGIQLKKYKFWLQDAQMLEPHKNLVDQCVEGKGIVQINVQVQPKSRRLNIVDVLKPTEDALEDLDNQETFQPSSQLDDIMNKVSNDDENALKWVIAEDCQFKKDQIKLNIPENPVEWDVAQVQHWLQWAVREFKMTQIKLSDWNIDGADLCNLSIKEFEEKVPYDPGNIFRTHFELLRRYKFVAVINKNQNNESDSFDTKKIFRTKLNKSKEKAKKTSNLISNVQWEIAARNTNGQIQLWQFLLDLLTDCEYKSIIQWITHDGEFCLINPEQVAKLWGIRKNKPLMNYEKLSRALRYYYDGDMISKVHGKRFVYKFVCDLKQLLGYDARELAFLVDKSAVSTN